MVFPHMAKFWPVKVLMAHITNDKDIFLGVLPVRPSEYMVLIQDPVFVPVVVECYAEITGPAVFIV